MTTSRLAVRRLRSPFAFVTRLVVTAMIAFAVARQVLTVTAPLLAPLTALLVVQATLYQTLWSAVQRVISVVAGVILAVALAQMLGFSWWSLALAISAGLVLGLVLRLGDNILEVPISAMLILQLGSGAAAEDRIYETLIGAGVGLLAGLVASPVRVEPAQQAVRELGDSIARLLADMANGLNTEPEPQQTAEWMQRSRELSREILNVDAELSSAEERARLNPRTAATPGPDQALRTALETLEFVATTTRGLTRCIKDRTGLFTNDREGLGAEMWEGDVRHHLARVLRDLATVVRDYGALSGASTGLDRLAETMRDDLDHGRRSRDELSWLLREDPGHWPLHGELLVHLDRLLDGLRDGLPDLVQRPGRRTPIMLPIPTIRRRQRGDQPDP